MTRRGGHRPGAGRPKGSKDRLPRKPSAPPPTDEVAERAFLDACTAFVQSGEPFRILREFLTSADASRRAWALDKLIAYGVGTPSTRPAPQEPTAAELFAQAARELRDGTTRQDRIAALIEAAKARRAGKPEDTQPPQEDETALTPLRAVPLISAGAPGAIAPRLRAR